MKKRLRTFPASIQNARKLRKQMTIPEKILWNALRNRRLDGVKFRRQHPIERFVIDFYCREKAVTIEIDGKVHDQAEVIKHDLERKRYLESKGVAILRFTNHRILKDLNGVLYEIHSALA
jgi:very-short-patch-repair endonuclease